MTRNRWMIFAALGLVWGTTWIASDAMAGIPPLLASSARFLLSAVCCLPFLLRPGAKLPGNLARLLLLSVTMIVLPLLLLVWARPQLPSATVVVLYAAMPLAVILLTPVLGRPAPPPRAMQAAVAGLGGLVLAMGASFSLPQAAAAAVVMVAVVSTAAASLLAQRALRQTAPLTVTAWTLGMAGLLLGVASLVWERGQPAAWDRHALLALILWAVLGGAPAYAAWFWLLQRLPAYQVATVQWIEPLVALGESAWLLGVGFSWAMIAGALVTIVSLVIVVRAREEDNESVSLRGIC